ncbi:tyrosine-type recombinase/integrase [Pseudalkalibacillus caeni]|uniref:Integrase n=1 Tax=Exobacillus caeni TaxID=2574798 RepID=A0A5R9F5P8_9BACL|nr:tyrosine-type recombinase/integrase [Pseudalkalibacillus caeni]TLS37730.1 integrase [Pseudalkalibacillus caeni]
MNLSELWSLYEYDKRIEGYSKHTLKAYQIQTNLLVRHFGEKDVEEITFVDLKQYLAKDADRLKPSSLGHRVRYIRSLFKWAHSEGYIPSNPSHKLKEPKQGKRVPKFIMEEDLEVLRESCKGAREKALISLLYSTGCRIGEVHLMDKQHINWDNKSIIVLGKGDKEREVYFDTKTNLWLREYLNQRDDEIPSLFITERNPKKRSSIAQLRYTVKRIAKRSNVNVNIYPHRFRHSYCTHLMDRGAPLEVISNLAGHAKIETTRIYAQLSGEKRRELYRKYF